jgi:hypothetical protein
MTAKIKLPKKSTPRKSYKPRKVNALTSYISVPVDLITKNKYTKLDLEARKIIISKARAVIINDVQQR